MLLCVVFILYDVSEPLARVNRGLTPFLCERGQEPCRRRATTDRACAQYKLHLHVDAVWDTFSSSSSSSPLDTNFKKMLDDLATTTTTTHTSTTTDRRTPTTNGHLKKTVHADQPRWGVFFWRLSTLPRSRPREPAGTIFLKFGRPEERTRRREECKNPHTLCYEHYAERNIYIYIRYMSVFNERQYYIHRCFAREDGCCHATMPVLLEELACIFYFIKIRV